MTLLAELGSVISFFVHCGLITPDSTFQPNHLPPYVDEEDLGEAAVEHEDRRRSIREVSRPQTPEPPLAELGRDAEIPSQRISSTVTSKPSLANPSLAELFRALQAQQVTAQTAIHLLELKVTELQQLVHATQTKVGDQYDCSQCIATVAPNWLGGWMERMKRSVQNVRIVASPAAELVKTHRLYTMLPLHL
jgi:hypothetical protein